MRNLRLSAIPDIPHIEPGDDIAAIVLGAVKRAGIEWADDDLLVLAQKIFSKAEDRYAYLSDVEPGPEAQDLAQLTHKDPRLVELILGESNSVLRHRPGVIIVEHRCGYVHANAGIDQSNIASDASNPRVLLLPLDCDASAEGLRQRIEESCGKWVNIIINDSAGRAWRMGTTGMALGTAGFEPLENKVGEADLFGRTMKVTEIAVADELAAAASYMMGQAAEGCPVVHVRGAMLHRAQCTAKRLIRDKEHDLFR